jgi:hypothetical protein
MFTYYMFRFILFQLHQIRLTLATLVLLVRAFVFLTYFQVDPDTGKAILRQLPTKEPSGSQVSVFLKLGW